MGERELECNWELGFLRVFLCTIVSPYFIVKSLQLRGRRQIAEPRKYCLVHVIVFFGVCFLYLFCFSQVGILVKFPTIWNLKVPNRVKHLLWRAAYNAIPTLCNLWRRNVAISTLCPTCKAGHEDTTHALWSCPSLFVVCEPESLLKKLLRYQFSSFVDLLGMVFSMKDRINVNLLAMCFWLIWNKRNSDRFDDQVVTLLSL